MDVRGFQAANCTKPKIITSKLEFKQQHANDNWELLKNNLLNNTKAMISQQSEKIFTVKARF